MDHPRTVDSTAGRSLRVVVVGAGAFGGWTALHLRRAGARVTLLDAWGPGNARSSSGGETRVMRAVYGSDKTYTEWTARALRMWLAFEKDAVAPLFRRTGVLWLIGSDDRYVRASLPLLASAALSYEELETAEAAKRYPQIDFAGVEWVLIEREAGYLRAAEACRAVRDRFVAEGGTYLQAAVPPGAEAFDDDFARLRLSDGSTVLADRYVFACGPWMGQLFPDLVGERLVPTRQEAYYFGAPPGSRVYHDDRLPVWVEFSDPIYYGVPATSSRAVKVADDTRGTAIDPTGLDRMPTRSLVKAAREYMGRRFPGMAEAPLVEARVCQYTNSPDGHFIVDRHPDSERVWLVSGGSGHGFKLGPALGQFVTGLLVEDLDPHPFFSLSRFAPL